MGVYGVTVIFLSLLMANSGVIASNPLSTDERVAAFSIIMIVGVLFVLFDLVLILVLICICCRRTSSQARKQGQHPDLNRSMEFIDAPVTLQFTKRHSSFNGSHKSSTHDVSEHSFNENNAKIELSKVPDVTVSIISKDSTSPEMEMESNDKVFVEKHLHTPQHQIKRLFDEHRSSRSHNRAVRKDSERFLLGTDDKSCSDDESIPSPTTVEEMKLESPSKEGEELLGSLMSAGTNRDSKHSESPEPHLVSITSKITGPIIPNDEPVGNVPREIQSLKFETVMEATNRKDSSAIEETSFDHHKSGSHVHERSGSHVHERSGSHVHERSGSYVHQRSASELMNTSVSSTGFTSLDNSLNQGNGHFPVGGSGVNDTFSVGSNDGVRSGSSSHILDHTFSGVSLGYTDILNTCQENETQVAEIIKRSKENLDQQSSIQQSPAQQSPIHRKSLPTEPAPQPVSMYQKYFNLSLSPNLSGSSEIPVTTGRPEHHLIGSYDHQRSSSLSYSTPQHWSGDVIRQQQIQHIRQQNPFGSWSASNTPKHQPKY